MSANEQQYAALPSDVIEAIINAANPDAVLSPIELEALQVWLSKEWSRSLQRASQKPLTKKDVDRLSRSLRRFQATIDSLQDRVMPPPKIPETLGMTEWDKWIGIFQTNFDIAGRRNDSDWLLISALLAIYERFSERRAAASRPGSLTMRFLICAFDLLRPYRPEWLGSNFEPPKSEALRKQIPNLRFLPIRQARRLIDKILAQSRE